jgi:hypothetical protein
LIRQFRAEGTRPPHNDVRATVLALAEALPMIAAEPIFQNWLFKE